MFGSGSPAPYDTVSTALVLIMFVTTVRAFNIHASVTHQTLLFACDSPVAAAGRITSWYKPGTSWDTVFGALASTMEECR